MKSEAEEQKNLFAWIRSKQTEIPTLQLAHSSLNGVRLAPRLRGEVKAQGMRAGIPDIFLPVANRKHHGLFIELKKIKGGRISPEQKNTLSLLAEQGYRAEVAYGAEHARKIILDYLGVEA